MNASFREPLEPGARASLRARLRSGPAGRAVAKVDLRVYRLVRSAAREPLLAAVRIYSRLGEHAALWLVLGAAGAVVDEPRRRRWTRALAAVAGTYLLNTAIKGVFRRRRPCSRTCPRSSPRRRS